jgi:hypothetical protein
MYSSSQNNAVVLCLSGQSKQHKFQFVYLLLVSFSKPLNSIWKFVLEQIIMMISKIAMEYSFC